MSELFPQLVASLFGGGERLTACLLVLGMSPFEQRDRALYFVELGRRLGRLRHALQ
jgi:hypothetical protein